ARLENPQAPPPRQSADATPTFDGLAPLPGIGQSTPGGSSPLPPPREVASSAQQDEYAGLPPLPTTPTAPTRVPGLAAGASLERSSRGKPGNAGRCGGGRRKRRKTRIFVLLRGRRDLARRRQGRASAGCGLSDAREGSEAVEGRSRVGRLPRRRRLRIFEAGDFDGERGDDLVAHRGRHL